MNEAVAARMAQLAARFAAQAPDHLRALDEALAAEDREAVASLAHRLAGIAGMFGHEDIGTSALALETAAESGADCREPADDLRARLARL